MGFPKYLAPFSAAWDNIGDVDETLRISWLYGASPGVKSFIVGSDIFLEDQTAIASVPDEQLLSSISMGAILAGGVLPGTQEFMNMMSDQSTTNFQTIVGNAKLKSVASASDTNVGPEGTVFDLEFYRVGNSSAVKVVRSDAWSICQYDNRIDSCAHAVDCVPGALHKQFAFKKSQLGAAGSANRDSVVAWLASQRFWV
jgi:hypothetical protein